MIQIFLLIFILLFPSYSEAAYKIYLKNGSIITGVSSYTKMGGEFTLYIGGGIFGISENDILKIEETEAPEKDFRSKEIPENGQEATAPAQAPIEEPADREKAARVNSLQADLDTINSELKTVEENEARLKASIEEKLASKTRYNPYQRYLIEKQIEPLQQELSQVQEKKGGLLQRKAYIEGELRSLK
jgi:hypothetical protein